MWNRTSKQRRAALRRRLLYRKAERLLAHARRMEFEMAAARIRRARAFDLKRAGPSHGRKHGKLRIVPKDTSAPS